MYYIELNNELIGPLSLVDLLSYDIQADTLILKDDGNSDWVPAKDLPELKDLFDDLDVSNEDNIINEEDKEVTIYKLKKGNEIIGDFKLEDIQLENIDEDTLIWTDGMTDWQNAYTFFGLNETTDNTNEDVDQSSDNNQTEERNVAGEEGNNNTISGNTNDTNDLYYIKKPNQPQIGPISIDKIREIGIDENTLIWTEGMPNWKNAIDFLGDISSPPPLPDEEKGINMKKAIIIASSSILILLVITYFALPYFVNQKDDFTEKIYQSYNKATVLIYNEFYYTINVNNEPKLYIGISDDSYSINESIDVLEPIGIMGSGFYISDNGEIITNRHVAYPWKSKSDNEFKAHNPDIFSIYSFGVDYLVKQGIDPSQISQSGITKFIGVSENNTTIKEIGDFRECSIIKHHNDFDIDVAKIQLKSNTLPENAIKIDLTNIADTKNLVVGSNVCILGFPGGLNFQDKSDEGIQLKVIANAGEISKEVTNYKVMYNVATAGGASGSPVFNDEGELVGVHYAGQQGKQGFNYAILAKYILDL